jgi:hypothetical protein
MDSIANQQWRENFDYAQSRDQAADREDAYNKLVALMTTYNYEPTTEEMIAAGMTEAQKNAILKPYYDMLAEQAPAQDASQDGGYMPIVDEIVEYGPGIDTTKNKNGMKASSWDYTKNNLRQLVRNGNTEGVDKYMSQISEQLSEEQFKEAIKIIEGKN